MVENTKSWSKSNLLPIPDCINPFLEGFKRWSRSSLAIHSQERQKITKNLTIPSNYDAGKNNTIKWEGLLSAKDRLTV